MDLQKKDLEHVVEGNFTIDGIEVVLKKIYREKWTRKKGFAVEEFTGNETTYFWNGVPLKKDEYNSKIADIISNEETFRLLTDIRYFNTLNWQQRRQMLFSLVDEQSVVPENEELSVALKGKTPDELRRELAASKKKILGEIDQAPTRIDEINRSLRTESEIEDVSVIDNELLSIDNQLASQNTANEEFNKKLSELNSKKSTIKTRIEDRRSEIRNSYRVKIQDDENEISRVSIELSSATTKKRS
jgi:exonuclease SbcC